MSDPDDETTTLTDDEVHTHRFDSGPSASADDTGDAADTGDDSGDAGDTGDDSGDAADTGDDSGDVTDPGDDSGDDS